MEPRAKALRYVSYVLAKSDLLESQLRERLQRREYAPGVIDEVIDEGKRLGWIDDRRAIDGFVRGQQRRLKGPRAIQAKLIQKGAPKELIEERLEQTREDQRHSIEQLIEGKYRERERHKTYAALVRRGFDPAVVRECLL